MQYRGSCHCGAIQFHLDAPAEIEAFECNCSMCAKSGYLHLIVPQSRLTLLCGAENLTTYTFNTGVAKHTFCKTCGVKPYYVPRSNPDGYSVNVRCLDPMPARVTVRPFDGRHWERDGARLAPLSREA